MLLIRLLPLVIIGLFLFSTKNAYAVDGAFMVFKDGKEANIRDGYKQLMAAMRKRKKSSELISAIVELNIDGNPLFIDTTEIAVLCRIPCRSFEVVKPKR